MSLFIRKFGNSGFNVKLALNSLIHTNRILRTLTRSAGADSKEDSLEPHEKLKSILGTRSVPEAWLRHNCQCSECLDGATHQKKFYFTPSTLQYAKVKSLSFDLTSNVFNVLWADNHKSQYSVTSLEQNLLNDISVVPKILWNNNVISSMPDSPVQDGVNIEEYMESEDGVKKLLIQLLRFGFGVVNGVSPTEDATVKVIERLSPIMKTIYGEFWTFTSEMTTHRDTAYTTEALKAHTDLSYYYTPAGLQVFHLLNKEQAKGGETLLVDGFNAAKALKEIFPNQYKDLCQFTVCHAYKKRDEERYIQSYDSVLKLNPKTRDDLLRIRFNYYDLMPLPFLEEAQVKRFFEAYGNLTNIINDSHSTLQIRLFPGTVLFIDNWRVLHGRNSFSGKRILCGAYVGREDWIGRAKLKGLL